MTDPYITQEELNRELEEDTRNGDNRLLFLIEKRKGIKREAEEAPNKLKWDPPCEKCYPNLYLNKNFPKSMCSILSGGCGRGTMD